MSRSTAREAWTRAAALPSRSCPARGSEHERSEADEPDPETHGHARQAAKAAWAKRIRKLYEVDPLGCPKCGAQMRVIALIEDPAVIERILSWLGLWHPPPRADLHRLPRTRAFRSPTIPPPTSPEARPKRRSQSSLFPNLLKGRSICHKAACTAALQPYA
jgi:hypothetical protein